MTDRPTPPLVLVSNRGPVSFRLDDDGSVVSKRGAGGLVSGLAPLVACTGVTWIAAAMSDGDRVVAGRGTTDAEGFRIKLLDLPEDQFRLAYDVVGNATLWYLHHHLWSLPNQPTFDHDFRQAWEAYRQVNAAFADAVIDTAPAGDVVLVKDYHLALLAPAVRANRPDLRLVHFSHTPFGNTDVARVLPSDVRVELFDGMTANHACGFHTGRWARTFVEACNDAIGHAPPTFVSPLASDVGDLEASAVMPATSDAAEELSQLVGDRSFLVRVDRIELSKNIVRGFRAFDLFLADHPEWRERVVFGAFVYPSREALPDYQEYAIEVRSVIDEINVRWGTPSWTPIHFEGSDDYPRSVAALQRYDVLLVNPLRDGLNLVAKEGPILNQRNGVVVLSTEAGVWDEVGDAALPVHPYDVEQTASQLHRALTMSAEQRASHARAMRQLATARTPADWLADQLAAATDAHP